MQKEMDWLGLDSGNLVLRSNLQASKIIFKWQLEELQLIHLKSSATGESEALFLPKQRVYDIIQWHKVK